MFARTPQPGLWFIAGSLAQCRIYSKYLALQIKADRGGAAAEASLAREQFVENRRLDHQRVLAHLARGEACPLSIT